MPVKKPQHDPDRIYTIGADIGYGEVKVVMHGAKPVKFPSVWGYAREIKFAADEQSAKYPGEIISDDHGEWFVGSYAELQVPTAQQMRLRGRTANEAEIGNVARVRLLKVALAKLFPGRTNGEVVHMRIATGLPVDHMRGAAELRGALLGQHVVRTNNTHFIVNITQVMIMPQPYGTIYRKMITPAGDLDPCHTAERTGVVDVGTYTIDLTLDDNGDYVDADSGSAEAGVHTALGRIRQLYEAEYGDTRSDADLRTILQEGCVKINGKAVNVFDWQREAAEIVVGATVNLMSQKWQNRKDIDVIYVSGGGAGLVFNDVKALYPQAELVEDAQFANAQGYLNYAEYDAKQ